MSQTTPEERLRLTAAAHEGRRGTPSSWQSAAARAKTIERNPEKYIRIGEAELAALLRERGHHPDIQKAVGPYSLDLALPPVAVEVHRSSGHPLGRADFRERTRHLVNAGWWVIYVWISVRPEADWQEIAPAVADEVVAFLELAESDPAPVGQYRVVRGSGERAAAPSLDPDNGAVVPPPVRRGDTLG